MFIVKHTWPRLSRWPVCPVYCIRALWLGPSAGRGGGGNGCTDHYINITSTVKAARLPFSDPPLLSFLTVCLRCSPPDNAPVPSSITTLGPKNNQEITLKAVCSGIGPFHLSCSESDNSEQKHGVGRNAQCLVSASWITQSCGRRRSRWWCPRWLAEWRNWISAKSCYLTQTEAYMCVCVCVCI